MTTTQQVYSAIANVTEQIAQEGIAKDRKNDQQGYKFRGIDDVYNALSPILAKNRLCILPNVMERTVTERQTSKGGLLLYVAVKVRFDFVSAEDGSKHEVITYGEAMDSGDKATNKAMSAAYKYAAMQAFCIPTEGDNDADSTTHTLAPAKREVAKQSEPEPDAEVMAQFNAALDVGSLTKVMNGLPQADKKLYTPLFNKRMKEIKEGN